MKENKLLGDVATYIYHITHCDWDGECYCGLKPCPFSSYEEARDAYLLHLSREESRNYLTDCDVWSRKYHALLFGRGIRVRKLRKRRVK